MYPYTTEGSRRTTPASHVGGRSPNRSRPTPHRRTRQAAWRSRARAPAAPNGVFFPKEGHADTPARTPGEGRSPRGLGNGPPQDKRLSDLWAARRWLVVAARRGKRPARYELKHHVTDSSLAASGLRTWTSSARDSGALGRPALRYNWVARRLGFAGARGLCGCAAASAACSGVAWRERPDRPKASETSARAKTRGQKNGTRSTSGQRT